MAADLNDNELEELETKVVAELQAAETKLTTQDGEADMQSLISIFAASHDALGDTGQAEFKVWMRS